jgi:hypothetical protein
MKSLRGKLTALLGAGMLLQVGGCSILDVLGDTLSGAIPAVLSGFGGP